MKAPLTPEMLDLLEEVRADAERRAYAAGQLDALRDFAREHARLELLGENWRDRAIADHEALIQARRDAALERYEARIVADNIAAGRHPDWRYVGQSRGGSGALCWETGYPVETANAWLSRPRWMPLPTTKARWIPAPVAEPLATVTELRPRRQQREAA